MLASECLKDDLAPLEPHARSLRIAFAAIAAALLALSAFDAWATRTWSSAFAFGVAALFATAAAAVPGYVRRARLAVVAASIALLGGLVALVVDAGGVAVYLARVVTATVLASVLFVRGTYRAHRPTRVALAIAIPLFASTAFVTTGVLAVDMAARGAIVLVALLAALGFMGSDTTAGCVVWGALTVVAATSGLVLDAVARGGALSFGSLPFVPCLGGGFTVALASLGVFQLVATSVAPRERAREELTPGPPRVA